MIRRSWILSLAFLTAAAAAFAQQTPQKKTLYQRLGGYDVIAKVVDDFLPRLLKEPKIASMIGGLANTSRERNRQMIVDQLCHETGGPCLYIGRTMEQAHQGLEITDALWEFSQKALGETLDANKVGEPERSELIAVVEKLRPEIVEKKKPEAKKAS
jgi:hemoglobin